MYSKIEVFGGCDINYIHAQKHIHSESEIQDVIDNRLYLPTWGQNTSLLATYQNTIDATSLSLEDGVVVGYQIQRLDVKNNVMKIVTQTHAPVIQDYNVVGTKQYQYYIFPVLELNGVKRLGKPIVSNVIEPHWDRCVIVGLLETDKPNEYIVDENNIWNFYLNVEQDNYTLNMDKVFTDGFDRFAKRTQGAKKYLSSSVNSILGTIVYGARDKMSVGAADLEKWEDFCYSSNLKLYSDMQGRVIPIDIQSVSSGYLTKWEDSPIVTNISFIQLADADDICVYGLGGI